MSNSSRYWQPIAQIHFIQPYRWLCFAVSEVTGACGDNDAHLLIVLPCEAFLQAWGWLQMSPEPLAEAGALRGHILACWGCALGEELHNQVREMWEEVSRPHSLRKDDLWALHRGTAEMRACGFQEVHTAKSLKLASTVQHEPCTMEVISSFFLGPTFRFVPSGLSHQIYHYLITDIIQFNTDKQKFPIRAADLWQHHVGF